MNKRLVAKIVLGVFAFMVLPWAFDDHDVCNYGPVALACDAWPGDLGFHYIVQAKERQADSEGLGMVHVS